MGQLRHRHPRAAADAVPRGQGARAAAARGLPGRAGALPRQGLRGRADRVRERQGLRAANYISDTFSRVTYIYQIAAYNVACAYAALGQIEAGLEVLEDCLESGYDDYSNVRKDPNLARLRENEEEFKELINRYDEPIFNENILKGIKNLFGGNK